MEKTVADETLQHKQAKAERYAAQPERFTVISIVLAMQSEHGTRTISLQAGVWCCTCEFFQERTTCSHIMAAQKLFILQRGEETKEGQ
jgi:hypothetical protein